MRKAEIIMVVIMILTGFPGLLLFWNEFKTIDPRWWLIIASILSCIIWIILYLIEIKKKVTDIESLKQWIGHFDTAFDIKSDKSRYNLTHLIRGEINSEVKDLREGMDELLEAFKKIKVKQ